MKYVTLTNLYAPNLVPHDRTPEEFCEEHFAPEKWLFTPTTIKTKYKSTRPLWSPAIFRSNEHTPEMKLAKKDSARHAENVLAVTALVLDMDSGTEQDNNKVKAWASRFEHIYHTSFSHDPTQGKFKERIIIPYAAPVDVATHQRMWDHIDRFAGKVTGTSTRVLDSKCRNESHSYYLASCPEERAEHADFKYQQGPALDPAALLAQAGERVEQDIKKAATVTPKDAEMAVKAKQWLQGSSVQWQPALKKAVQSLLKGESYASEGGRDDLTNVLCSRIAFKFPRLHTNAVVELFEPSIRTMEQENPNGAITLDNVAAKFEDAVSEFEAKVKEEKGNELRLLTRGARSEPLSDEEKEAQAKAEGFQSVEQWEKAHILETKTGSVYVRDFVRGYDGPFTSKAINRAALSLTVYGVELESYEDGKVRPKNYDMLFKRYGSFIKKSVAHLAAQKAHYDHEEEIMFEAPTPLRKIEATYHQEVHEWLLLLGGERLLQWVASVTLLDEQLSCLYMWGKSKVGKSLLYTGLSQLWSNEGVTELSKVLGRTFNASVLNCPFLAAKEGLAKDKWVDTANLVKEMLGDKHSSYERKYFESSSIKGVPRIMIASNSANELHFHQEMSKESLEATAERFFIVEAPPAAADYLVKLGGPEYLQKNWLDTPRIAQHALWLRDQPQYKASAKDRILVPGDKETFSFVSTLPTNLLFTWIVQYLKNPVAVESSAKPGEYERANGQLSLTSAVVTRHWMTYIPQSQYAPHEHALSNILSSISTAPEASVREVMSQGVTQSFSRWPIDMERVIQFAEKYRMGSRKELMSKLGNKTNDNGTIAMPPMPSQRPGPKLADIAPEIKRSTLW